MRCTNGRYDSQQRSGIGRSYLRRLIIPLAEMLVNCHQQFEESRVMVDGDQLTIKRQKISGNEAHSY